MSRLHYPDGFDDTDKLFLDDYKRAIPDGSLVEGMVVVFSYINPESGAQQWGAHSRFDIPVSQIVGLLDMAKLELLHRSPGVVSGLSVEPEDD